MEETKPQPSPSPKEQVVMDLEKQYLMQTYARYPLVIERGRGCWVYDINGKRYLDFLAGLAVNALGHAHPRIVRAIRDQAAKAVHVSNLYYHPFQGRLAERLAKITGLDRVFFCNSGTEAIEGALKLARAYNVGEPDKHHIVALENSFHGRTFGALSATGQAKYRTTFQPLLPGVTFARFNDLNDLRSRVNDRTSAILIEPVQGEGGIFELSHEYMRGAEELARQHHAVLIVDEIQCGFGRTGAYFAHQRAGIRPDVLVMAKPLAAGLPLGAFAARQEVAESLAAGMHGTTFGGGPLACRVALEFLDVMEQENMIERINKVGAAFHAELVELQRRFPFIKAVRGTGLMLALDLEFPGRQVVLDALEAGLLINCTHETVLRFLPPYIITEELVDRGVRILQKILAKVIHPPKEASVSEN